MQHHLHEGCNVHFLFKLFQRGVESASLSFMRMVFGFWMDFEVIFAQNWMGLRSVCLWF